MGLVSDRPFWVAGRQAGGSADGETRRVDLDKSRGSEALEVENGLSGSGWLIEKWFAISCADVSGLRCCGSTGNLAVLRVYAESLARVVMASSLRTGLRWDDGVLDSHDESFAVQKETAVERPASGCGDGGEFYTRMAGVNALWFSG